MAADNSDRESELPGLANLLGMNKRGSFYELSLSAGDEIKGTYRIDGVIGTGAFGKVYSAWHKELNTTVAIKVLEQHLDRKVVRAKFLQEARMMARINSEHVVPVSDCGFLPDGRPYYVMEKLAGQTLRERLRREGSLGVEESIDIGEGLLLGLSEIHRKGVVHADVKPANIMLCKSGARVRMLDFGLAETITQARERGGGTPPYMAPEVLSGEHSTSPAADLYAVAVVLYEMLAGSLPRGRHDMSVEEFRVSVQQEPVPIQMHNETVPTVVAELLMEVLTADAAACRPSADAMRRRLRRAGVANRVGTADTVPVRLAEHDAGEPRTSGRRSSTHRLALGALVVGLVAPLIGPRDRGDIESPIVVEHLPDSTEGRIIIAVAESADEEAKRRLPKLCTSMKEAQFVGPEQDTAVACMTVGKRLSTFDQLTAEAEAVGAGVVISINDETVDIYFTTRGGGSPLTRQLRDLALPRTVGAMETITPVLRGAVFPYEPMAQVPPLAAKEVGPRWALLAEYLRESRGDHNHDTLQHRRDLVEANCEGEAKSRFYCDLARFIHALCPGMTHERSAEILEGLFDAVDGRDDNLRGMARLEWAYQTLESGPCPSDLAKVANVVRDVTILDDTDCIGLLLGGIELRLAFERKAGFTEGRAAGRLRGEASGRCSRPVLHAAHLRAGDAYLDVGRWCDAARHYEMAYHEAHNDQRLDSLLRWAEAGVGCTSGEYRDALLHELDLERLSEEALPNLAAVAYLRWLLSRKPADAIRLIEVHAEVPLGQVPLSADVATDLPPSPAFRILVRPKRTGDTALLSRELDLAAFTHRQASSVSSSSSAFPGPE